MHRTHHQASSPESKRQSVDPGRLGPVRLRAALPTLLLASCATLDDFDPNLEIRSPIPGASAEHRSDASNRSGDSGAAQEFECFPPAPLERQIALITEDLDFTESAARPFMRYFVVSECAAAWPAPTWSATDVQQALTEALALVSRNSELLRPRPLGEWPPQAFAIDLRDYGLDAPVTVEAQGFSDGWDALSVHTKRALEFTGPRSNQIRNITGSDTPWLPLEPALAALSYAPLYYELQGVPKTLGALFAMLELERTSGPSERAGTAVSEVTPWERRFERWPVEGGQALWLAYNHLSDPATGSVFTDPLGASGDEAAALFPRPNGLLGFAVYDGAGERLDTSEALVDRISQADLKSRPAVSCGGCHVSGPLPIEEQVRPFVEANLAAFPRETLDRVRAEYPLQAELDSLIDQDSRLVESSAFRLGMSRGASPLQSAILRHGSYDVAPSDAARMLRVSRERLRLEAAQLPLALRRDSMSRAAFDEVFLPAYCTLHAADSERPVACDEAAP